MKNKSTLDKQFEPINLALKEYEEKTKNGMPYSIALERENGLVYVFNTKINAPMSSETIKYIERIIKSLLYVVGGHTLYLAGNYDLGHTLSKIFSLSGARSFDVDMMTKSYSLPFRVVVTDMDKMPKEKSDSYQVGGNNEGCRIGFDAGGSDRKVCAVKDGEVVYSEEVVWFPKLNSDPTYHYEEIVKAMRTAAAKLPRVDAIGISTAGIVVDNKIKVASLFLKVSEEDFKKSVENIYIKAAKAVADVPVLVANDGDVTALAGAIQLKCNGVLGMAMGTSEATGYFNTSDGLNGWLNELAFVPVDYNEYSAADEWSGDYGCGVKYFSQDSVIKLADMAGMKLNGNSPAEKLKEVQALMNGGDKTAAEIFKTIGIYLAHTLPYYSRFYEIKYVLLLGRVMSGKGGDLILETCQRVLSEEYSDYSIHLATPDEYTRRVGQSVIAATLPKIV